MLIFILLKMYLKFLNVAFFFFINWSWEDVGNYNISDFIFMMPEMYTFELICIYILSKIQNCLQYRSP